MKQFYEPQAAWGGSAEKAEPYYLSSRYIAQEKLDGARYIISYDVGGFCRIYSRKKSVESIRAGVPQPVDKTAQLQHLAREVMSLFPKGTVLDGEVIGATGQSSSMTVTKVTGASPEKALAEQEANGFVRYAVFDCLVFAGRDITSKSWKERMDALEVLRLNPLPHVRLLSYTAGEEKKRKLYRDILKHGGEGIILKDYTAPYYEAKRHKSWVKHKKVITLDVVVMGTEAAEEESVKKADRTSESKTKAKYAGQVGSIVFGQYVQRVPDKGSLFSVPGVTLTRLGTVSGFDEATRLDLTNNYADWHNTVIEIEAQERLPSGSVRHPRFKCRRPDKSPEDCGYRVEEG